MVMPNYMYGPHKKLSARVWADEEVATLLSTWEHECIQEQLDRMSSQT